MKFGPAGAIGRGRALCDPLPSPRSIPLPPDPRRDHSPCHPWHALLRRWPSAPSPEKKLVCGGRGLAKGDQTRWARGVGRAVRTQVCEEEGQG